MFNRGLRKKAKRNLEYEVENYNEVVEKTDLLAKELYSKKCELKDKINSAMDYINSLKNTPDHIDVVLEEIKVQYREFEDLVSDAEYDLLADDIKYTCIFGIGYMVAQSRFLLPGLVIAGGPLGWLIGGGMFFLQDGINKKAIEEINEKILEVKEATKNQELLNSELIRVRNLLGRDTVGIRWMLASLNQYPTDYTLFNEEQRKRAGAFVNCVKASACNMNRSIDKYGKFRFSIVDWEKCGVNPQ